MGRRAWLVGVALLVVFVAISDRPAVNAQNASSQRVWVKPAGSTVLYAGTATATTTAAALAASQVVSELVVQCDPDNAVDCFVGNSTAQTIQLKPGQSLSVPVDNVSRLFVKTASSTAAVNYMGRN